MSSGELLYVNGYKPQRGKSASFKYNIFSKSCNTGSNFLDFAPELLRNPRRPPVCTRRRCKSSLPGWKISPLSFCDLWLRMKKC